MKSLWFGAAALVLLSCGGAAAAEPIVGNWRTQSGETAKIASCGGDFCTTLMTGAHKGRQIGKMRGSGASYEGSITDPANDKTYSGSATVSGKSMKLTGCALKVFCRSQTWTKQ